MKKFVIIIVAVFVLASCYEHYWHEEDRYLKQRLEENKRILDDAKKLEQELNDMTNQLNQWLLRHKFHLQDA